MATIESASTVGIPSSIGAAARPRSGIVVHYNGPELSRGAHSTCRAQVRSMHTHHRNGNGWAGIGYHYLICHHGTIMTGRGLNRVGAHAPRANSTHVGVQLMLGGSQQPTTNMLRGFRELRAWLRSQGVADRITGHRDWGSTSCPGEPLYRRVRSGDWGTGGESSTGGDPLIGLKKGDRGEAVGALQLMLKDCGGEVAEALGTWGPNGDGVDEDYGDDTAEALRLARERAGSEAKAGWGNKVSGHAYVQLMRTWVAARTD